VGYTVTLARTAVGTYAHRKFNDDISNGSRVITLKPTNRHD